MDSGARRVLIPLENKRALLDAPDDGVGVTGQRTHPSIAEPTRGTMHDYVELLSRFVNREYDTQKAQVYEMWSRPIGQRVAEGEAIADLEVVQVLGNTALLRCRDNLSKFRRGDTVRLSQGIPTQYPYYTCEIEEDRGRELVIRAGYQVSFYGLGPGGGWTLDREDVDVRFLLQGALAQLADGSGRSEEVLSILQGRVPPRVDSRLAQRAAQVARDLGFDHSQAEAYSKALACERYYLIQGPPGTGKTFVLAHLATTLASQGQRVLVTAFTHRAINNALRKIGKETGFARIAKIGQTHNADDLAWDGGVVPNYERLDSSPFAPADRALIVGGTCFALRSSRLRDVTFDTVIFDEAGQVTLPVAVAGMLAGSRCIFIGDHKQMAPVVVAEHRPEWVARSVFESLFDTAPGTMLTTTYRMNAEINDYPSKRFYDGRLQPSSDARARRLHLDGRAGTFGALLEPSPSAVFVEIDHSGKGMRAPEEAVVAAGVVAEALRRGLDPSEIAVVAPYRAQVRLIREQLREQGVPLGEGGVVVDTVERIQGQERDVIVVSLTTSDPGHAAQRADFYFQPNRLNVAITRPRVKRIVIGSRRLFLARPAKAEHREWVEHFRGLYDSSQVFHLRLT